MRAAGVRDFSPKDLLAPDVKRLKKNLSALINFTKFREERAIHFHQLQEATSQIIEQKSKLEIDVQDIQSKLQVMRAKREQEEPMIQSLQKDIKDVQAEIMNLNQQQASLQLSVRDYKGTVADLKDRVASNKFTLMNIRQDCTTLRGQIVQSPEKIRKVKKPYF
jgi:kinetochore protein Nuf2